MGRLQDKIAIVTGGAQGQGAAITRAYVAEGARVAIADLADEPGTLLAKELCQAYGGDSAIFVHHDVSSEESWSALVAEVGERLGAPTVLANNAGILRFNEIVNQPVEEFELLWRVNTLGCFLGIKTVAPGMIAAGGGSIINASSIEGLAGMPVVAGYTSTKFAIRGPSPSGCRLRRSTFTGGSTRCGATPVSSGATARLAASIRQPRSTTRAGNGSWRASTTSMRTPAMKND